MIYYCFAEHMVVEGGFEPPCVSNAGDRSTSPRSGDGTNASLPVPSTNKKNLVLFVDDIRNLIEKYVFVFYVCRTTRPIV